jgi:hypothetical protein
MKSLIYEGRINNKKLFLWKLTALKNHTRIELVETSWFTFEPHGTSKVEPDSPMKLMNPLLPRTIKKNRNNNNNNNNITKYERLNLKETSPKLF